VQQLRIGSHAPKDLAHLPQAIHIPLSEVVERATELDAARPVLVICHAGVRSLSAAALLSGLGYTATSVRGGTEAWSARIDPTFPRY
jgi:rhodanese-related sulfurtransferase